MKKLLAVSFFLLACLALLPQPASAQNFSTVTASHLSDASGNPIASGTICFLGTDLNDNPIAFRPGGGGQAIIQEVCAPISAGAIVGTFQAANPANTSPANIAYRVTVTSQTPRGNLRYNVVQFTGSPFNFDNYVPTSVPIPLGESANVFAVNQLIITGSCTGCSGGILTLSTNGTNNTAQTALNFQNGATVNGLQIQPSNPSGANEQFAISGIVTVPGGGTGLGTLAAHQLYVGNGTSTPNPVAIGASGQVLESGGPGVDPAFQDPIVSGPDAVGATPTRNPVAIGCLFLTSPATLTNNQVGEAACDSTQHLLVDVLNSTLAVTQSGTWTVQQGGAPWSVSQSGNWTTRIVGNAGGILDAAQNAAAPPNELVAGAVYNATLPSLTNGGATQLQAGPNGGLVVDLYSYNGSSWSPASPWPADNSAFTAATTPSGVIAGWYSTSPTACTTGNLCAPSLTSDRKLFVQSFQGTSPWVVSNGGTFAVQAAQSGTWTVQPGNTPNTTAWLVTGTGGTFPVTGTFWQATQPVSCTTANCSINLGNWGGTALGTPTTFGTTPGTVIVGSVNASLFAGTTALSQTGGSLNVNITGGAGSGGTALPDEGTFTQGTTSFTPIGGTYNSSITNLSSGQGGSVQLTNDRMMFVNIGKINGTAPSLTGSSLNVNITGGAGSGGTAMADEAAFTEGTTQFTPAGCYFKTSPTNLTTGEAGAFSCTNTRHLMVDVVDALPAGGNVIGAITQSGTWNDRIQDASGNGLTSNSTTYTSKFGLDENLLGTLGTAFSTPGFVDIKGADGNIFVRQATAANLNATVVGTGTFAVQAAQSGTWTVQPGNTPNTTPWLFTINQGGNSATVNASGQLSVNCALGCPSIADQGAFTIGTTNIAPTGGSYNPSAANLAVGQAGVVQMTADRMLFENVGRWMGSSAPFVGPKNSANAIPITFSTDQMFYQAPNGLIGPNGAPPSYGMMVGCEHQNMLPVLAGNQIAPCQADSSGRTLVDVAVMPPVAVKGFADAAGTQASFDPCQAFNRQYFNVNTSSNVQIAAGSPGKNYFICGATFPPQAAAANVAFVESATAGNACATSPVGMMGGSTAATGANIAANGGFILPNAGYSYTHTFTPGDSICLAVSAQTEGVVIFVGPI